ncbi:MAG TPA: hypothetical protein DCO72_05045 [Ruminococcus sp.]|nr:hypothetical protein [Ruminococcus sp.]
MDTALLIILLIAVAGDIGFTAWHAKGCQEKFSQLENKVNSDDTLQQLKDSQEKLRMEIKSSSDFEFTQIHKDIKDLQNRLSSDNTKELQASLEAKIQELLVKQSTLEQSLQGNNSYIQELYKAYNSLSGQQPASIDWEQLYQNIDQRITAEIPDMTAVFNRLNALEKLNASERLSQLEAENNRLRSELETLKQSANPPAPPRPSIKIEPEVVTGTAVQPPQTETKSFVPPEQNLIIPDENYINFLKENAGILEGALQERFYRNFIKTLDSVLDDGDFDDPEEIMCDVHGAVEKNIFDSFSRVKRDNIPVLDKFLKIAGYVPLNIGAGDNVLNCAEYFQQLFPEKPSNPNQKNLIKQINTQPYQLCYDNDGTPETLVLKGDCTYYGGNFT